MTRTVRFNLVDVFTDVPLAGNQLGVFTDARGLASEQMLSIAREIGFSECVFLLPAETGGDARVRIFTPASELAFAGHPVLGAAFVLGGPMQLGQVTIETGAGLVPVTLEREGARLTFGRMSQPIPTWHPFDRAAELLAALGVEASGLPVDVYDNGMEHAYVALPSAEAVASVRPDFAKLEELTAAGASCFFADSSEPARPRVKTRMFAPADGVAEDPATGSAAGPLAVHLARHGLVEWGREIEISQGAELHRPSTLFACAEGSADGGVTRVEVGGSAIVVGRGELQV